MAKKRNKSQAPPQVSSELIQWVQVQLSRAGIKRAMSRLQTFEPQLHRELCKRSSQIASELSRLGLGDAMVIKLRNAVEMTALVAVESLRRARPGRVPSTVSLNTDDLAPGTALAPAIPPWLMKGRLNVGPATFLAAMPGRASREGECRFVVVSVEPAEGVISQFALVYDDAICLIKDCLVALGSFGYPLAAHVLNDMGAET